MRWYITTENNKFVIRGGKGNKRLPIRQYSAMRHDEEQLKRMKEAWAKRKRK